MGHISCLPSHNLLWHLSNDLHRKEFCAILWILRAVSETEIKRGPSARGLTSSQDSTAQDLLASLRPYILGLLAADMTNIARVPQILLICVDLLKVWWCHIQDLRISASLAYPSVATG